MTRKSFRNIFCATTVAVLGTFGTGAQATQYDVGFDPPFTIPGLMVIDVPLGSPCRDGGVQLCGFEVLSVNFTDTAGDVWDILGPETPSGSKVDFNPIGTLIGIQVTISDLNLVSTDDHGPPGCDGAHLSIALDGSVTFDCAGKFTDTGTVTSITLVPEPATLALLGLGLAGIAVARRRKLN